MGPPPPPGGITLSLTPYLLLLYRCLCPDGGALAVTAEVIERGVALTLPGFTATVSLRVTVLDSGGPSTSFVLTYRPGGEYLLSSIRFKGEYTLLVETVGHGGRSRSAAVQVVLDDDALSKACRRKSRQRLPHSYSLAKMDEDYKVGCDRYTRLGDVSDPHSLLVTSIAVHTPTYTYPQTHTHCRCFSCSPCLIRLSPCPPCLARPCPQAARAVMHHGRGTTRLESLIFPFCLYTEVTPPPASCLERALARAGFFHIPGGARRGGCAPNAVHMIQQIVATVVFLTCTEVSRQLHADIHTSFTA